MIRTVRIFLSSPGDVAAERMQVRDLLLGLARGPFVRGRVHIDVVSWDDPHAPAAMDARFTPQQAVDRSLPMPADCDLTVVLLWSRMGTPLAETRPDGTQYLSGTEWEFENAIDANKPVFVYRDSRKVLLDPDDPAFDDRLVQKRRVDDFFQRFAGEGGTIRRSHSTYASAADLLQRIRQDAEGVLSGILDGSLNNAARVRSASLAVPAAYRDWVKKQFGGVDLLGLQLKKGRPPSLSAIYVPQVCPSAADTDAELRAKHRAHGRPAIDEEDLARSRFSLAVDRLGRESLYVSGAPGTGKSTLCRWVAWLAAEGAMPAAEIPPPDEFVETFGEGLRGRLPVLIRLREFWELLPARAEANLTVSDLEETIGHWLDRKRPDALDSTLFRAHLKHGSVLLVLDGMDEVPVSVGPGSGVWYPRRQLIGALVDAVSAWAPAGNRLLLTSRPYGVSEEDAARLALAAAPLQPLPGQLQHLLAQRWFAVISGSVDEAAVTTRELFDNIASQPWLVELAANPLLLTAMCIVFDEGKRLPQDKHDLYERVVATVLFSRYRTPAEIDQAKRELGVIAYGMHTGAGVQDGRTTPRPEATFHEVERWLQHYRELKDYTDRSEATAFEARESLLSQSGLFLSTGDRRAGFAHLSFQEFFAAQRSFTVDEARLAAVFQERAGSPEWRNTLSFLFGRLVATFPEPTKAIELLETRLAAATAGETSGLLVLADAARILTGKGITLRAESLERLQQVLLEAATAGSSAAARVEVGSALGQLGDRRFRADAWYLPDDALLGLVEVPEGPFRMGSDKNRDLGAWDDELPQHEVAMPAFYIARWPVTVAQFRAFVESPDNGGFRPGDPDCLRGVPTQPVVSVSWHEALAYARWLNAKLRTWEGTPARLRALLNGENGPAWSVTLPSEAEWEKAARGADGRIYPWGDTPDPNRANYHDTGIGQPSAVGCFPGGASPFGVEELSGNVWEWTRSHFARYEYVPGARREDLNAGDDVSRVVRGGAFDYPVRLVRAACRFGDRPDLRGGFIGCRLVVSPFRS
jgi:formylglycine-generating enzyme required for sulfatase activity